jgi:acetyl-CoA acetyltransferase
VAEAHVEMDGAWAAYYAWLKILSGEAASALIIAWGKSSEGELGRVLNTELDPFCLAPLGLDHLASAGLQADAWARRTGCALPPLEHHFTDGACALVLAAEERVRVTKPVWIVGADHRSESGSLGHRDLSRLPSASLALERAARLAGWHAPDVAELSASFSHQERLLAEAFALSEATEIHTACAEDPVMATGLVALANCARRLDAKKRRGLSHAASGHALQQNLVFLLEAGA